MTDYAYKQIENKRINQWLLSYFRLVWPRLLVLIVLSLVSVGLSLLNPWPLKILIDSVFGTVPAPGILEGLTGRPTLLIIIAAAFVGMFLVSGLLDILDSYLSLRFSGRMSNDLQSSFFRHILNLPIDVKRKREAGDYVYRLNEEADNIPALIFDTTVSVVSSSMMIIVALIILFTLNWQLALVGLLVVPLLVWSIRHFTPRIGQMSEEIADATAEIYTFSSESIEDTTTIQAFNRQNHQVRVFRERLQNRLSTSLNLTLLSGRFEYSNNVFTSIGTAVVLLAGGFQVFQGHVTIGELLIFTTYMGFFYEPLQTILTSVSDYKSLMAGVKRVFAVLRDPADDPDAPAAQVLVQRVAGRVEFKGVSFGRGERMILQDVTFEIRPGQKVAFVGPSGSGKSTLLSLVPLFNRPNSGVISIDGKLTKDVSLHSLRDQIGFVSQEPSLFSGSIHENIGFAIPDEKLDLPEIIAAAQAANAYEFIKDLPDGFDTDVGEAGDNLSGGQKQRIAIARAFVKNPPILILDEPTSALDHESGTKLLGAIRRLMSGKTVLMSTHETSLLKDMDVIYIVEDGKVINIAERGGLDAYLRSLNAKDNTPNTVL